MVVGRRNNPIVVNEVQRGNLIDRQRNEFVLLVRVGRDELMRDGSILGHYCQGDCAAGAEAEREEGGETHASSVSASRGAV